ncbi:MAG: cytochrome c [Pirellulaceae bacterium]|jgi:cytochrome c2|nr:cytochrome c [Pirellulaceae bacterium]
MVAHRQLVGLAVLCSIVLCAASANGQDDDPVRGKKLYHHLGCHTCHTLRGKGGPSGSGVATEIKAPDLAVAHEGEVFYGSMVEMSDGSKVKVTDEYLLESITNPKAKVVKDPDTGRPYPADKMPDRFRHLPKKDLAALVAFIKAESGVELPSDADQPVAIKADATIAADATIERGSAGTALWVWILLGFCGVIAASIVWLYARKKKGTV